MSYNFKLTPYPKAKSLSLTPHCLKEGFWSALTVTSVRKFGTGQIPEGYADHNGFGPRTQNNDWFGMFAQFPILTAIMILAVLVFLFGTSYSALYCLGKCGAATKACETRMSKLMRHLLMLLMLMLLVMLFFALITASVNSIKLIEINRQMHESEQKRSKRLSDYIELTFVQLWHIFNKNTAELKEHILEATNAEARIVGEMSEQRSKDLKLSVTRKIAALADDPQVEGKLKRIEREIYEFSYEVSRYQDFYRYFQCNMTNYLVATRRGESVFFNASLREFPHYNVNLETLYEIYTLMDIIRDIINFIRAKLEHVDDSEILMKFTVRSTLNDIEREIGKFVDKQINEKLEPFGANISKQINKMHYSSREPEFCGTTMYVCGLIVVVLGIFVLMLFILALLFGLYGKYTNDEETICTKTNGAKLMILGIALVIAIYLLLAFFAIWHFLIGTVAFNGICHRQHKHIQYSYEGAVRQINQEPVLLTSCHTDRTIYNISLAHNLVKNIREVNIVAPLQELEDHIEHNLLKQISSAAKKIHKTLQDKTSLKNKKETFDAVAAADKMQVFKNNKICNLDKYYKFDEIVKAIRTISQYMDDEMQDFDDQNPYSKNRVYFTRCNLMTLQSYVADPLKFINLNCEEIYENIFNGKIDRETEKSVSELDKASDFYANYFNKLLSNFSTNVTHIVNDSFTKYLQMATKALETDIARCAPFAEAHNPSFFAICNCLLDPLNGYWASVFLALFLLLPLLLLAPMLAYMFNKPCYNGTIRTAKRKQVFIHEKADTEKDDNVRGPEKIGTVKEGEVPSGSQPSMFYNFPQQYYNLVPVGRANNDEAPSGSQPSTFLNAPQQYYNLTPVVNTRIPEQEYTGRFVPQPNYFQHRTPWIPERSARGPGARAQYPHDFGDDASDYDSDSDYDDDGYTENYDYGERMHSRDRDGGRARDRGNAWIDPRDGNQLKNVPRKEVRFAPTSPLQPELDKNIKVTKKEFSLMIIRQKRET